MSHRRLAPLASLAALAILLAGCTIPTGSAPPGQPGVPGLPGVPALPGSSVPAGADASITAQPGRAPSRTDEAMTVRADQVVRTHDRVTVALTAAATREWTMNRFNAQVLTSSGIKLPLELAERTVPAATQAQAIIAVDVPDRSVTSLKITLGNLQKEAVDVPIPAADETYAWRAAPLRQTAPAAQLQRGTEVQFLPETLRSEGLVTEIGFQAASLGRSARVDLCSHRLASTCVLTEPDGTAHPLLGEPPLDVAPGERVTGTLRFLGELAPEATDLTLGLRILNGPTVEPVPLTLPQHAESPSVLAPASLTRAANGMKPVVFTDQSSGAQVTVSEVAAFADQVQLTVSVRGGKDDFDLTSANVFQASTLTEPTGAEHELVPPPAADLTVSPGETFTATLVFRGGVPADVTRLTYHVGGASHAQPPATATLALPAGTAEPPAAPASLGQLEGEVPPPLAQPRPPVAPTAASPAASSEPQASLLSVALTPLPVSHGRRLPALGSARHGSQAAVQTASAPTADPLQEAAVQRSLKELGARKTPDGYEFTLPETVLFDYNKAEVKPDADATIGKVAKLLAYYDKAKIKVEGHTDTDGDEAANLELSKRRAQAVATRLQSKSIASSRLSVEGFGEAQPVAPNDNDANKAKNRRVTIVLNEAA